MSFSRPHVVMSSVARKVGRVFYYARNVARDCAPQLIFRRRLPGILQSAARYDAAYLAHRVNYYNRLSAPVELGDSTTSIGGLPMGKSAYYYDLKEHARYFPRHFRMNYFFGDRIRVQDRATLIKARLIGGDNRNSVLMKLGKFRHFYFPPDRTPFKDKKAVAVWRGSAHKPSRRELLRAYHQHPLCDVGHTDRSTTVGRKPFLSTLEQMQYRFVISLEGNDVATNLKWILASNCLCFMPKPSREIWFMEGQLEAGRHYVELRPDFADLEDRIQYYTRHVEEALAIIRNANEYVVQFLDEPRERLISLLVLYKYFVVTGQLDPDPGVVKLIQAKKGS